MSSAHTIDVLKSNILFNDKELLSLNFQFSAKNFEEIKEGNLIFKPGEASVCVYLIIKGEVKLKTSFPKQILTKTTNDFFGDIEILQGSLRKSTAMANSDCLVYKLDGELFKNIIQHPEPTANTSTDAVLSLTDSEISDSEQPEIILNTDDIKLNTEEPQNLTGQLQFDNDVEHKDNHVNEIPVEINNENYVDLTTVNQSTEEFETYNDQTNANEYESEKMIDNVDTNEKMNEGNLDFLEENNRIEILENTETYSDELVGSAIQNTNFSKYESLLQPSSDFKKTVKDILHFLLKQTDSENGAFYIYDPNEEKLEDYYQTTESFYKTKKSLQDSITGIVAREKKIRFAVSVANDSYFNPEIDVPNDFDGRTIIFIPLLDTKNNLLGIVQIGSHQTDFTKDEEKSIEDAAKYCSVVFEKSLNFVEPVKEKNQNSDLNFIANFLLQDVKAPLMNIKSYAAILSRYNLPDEVKKVIALISTQSSSIIDLIQSSIDYSNQSTEYNFEETSFNDAMNQILMLLSDYVESRNVKLFKKFSKDAIVKIDERKFYVACYYITKFACDMMPDGGNLYFSSYAEDGKIILKIRDESKGIGNMTIDDIMENFSIDENKEYSGLGLAIAKFIIEAMQSELIIEPSSMGISYSIFLHLNSQ